MCTARPKSDMKRNNQQELQEEFTRVLERHKRMIIMVCRAYVGDVGELEDAFQEVAARLWQGFPSFRADSKESTWVYRVALNTCINLGRLRQRRPATEPLLDREFVMVADDKASHVEQLYALIRTLDPFSRALILLWLENLSYDEIGLIMGISAKNVSVKLSRIRKELKEAAQRNH